MSKEEVRKLLGDPYRVASRQLVTDLREVWIYRQTGCSDYALWTFMSIITVGLWLLVPVSSSEYHFLVFSDNVLIGWDLPDPYAPDLIIEKRER